MRMTFFWGYADGGAPAGSVSDANTIDVDCPI